jgi:raffinose/stachyose/melibiose transport system substrate-binding protein
VLVETGNLPAMPAKARPSTPAGQDVFEAWRTLSERSGLVPYLDYATPTFFDDLSGAIQRLLAERVEPDAFARDVQSDYAKFTETL